MATSYKTVTERALTYIKNDRDLQFDMDCRPPVFYNRMNGYLKNARTLVNRPPEILERTAEGIPPAFCRIELEAKTPLVAGAAFATGAVGYELCCAGLLRTDAYGGAEYVPLGVEFYDPYTGYLTLKDALAEGDRLELCFYSDGSFAAELNESEINLLGYAVYALWEMRQDNDALERRAKLRDSSFSTISEAAQTDANTTRLKLVKETLEGMIRRYEEELEYKRVIKAGDQYVF